MASPPAFTFTAPPPTPIDGIVRTERFVPANPDKNITAHTAYTICYTRTATYTNAEEKTTALVQLSALMAAHLLKSEASEADKMRPPEDLAYGFHVKWNAAVMAIRALMEALELGEEGVEGETT